MIGVILSSRRIRHLNPANVDDDYILFYSHLARQNNVDLCFYSVDRINVKNKSVRGYVYLHKTDRLAEKNVNLTSTA